MFSSLSRVAGRSIAVVFVWASMGQRCAPIEARSVLPRREMALAMQLLVLPVARLGVQLDSKGGNNWRPKEHGAGYLVSLTDSQGLK